MTMTAKEVIARNDRLFSDRSTTASHWDEVSRFCYPLSGPVTGWVLPGAKRYTEILRNTAEYAHDLAVAGMFGLLTNPATRWAKVEPEDERLQKDDAVARWCDDATRRLFTILNRPEVNAYPALAEMFNDQIGFGTAATHIAERPGKLPLMSCRPMREVAVAEGADGRVDTVYRQFELEARQAVQEYGDDAGPKTREKAEKDPMAKIAFIHATYPRSDYRGSTALTGAKAMPVASVHVNKAELLVVRDSGHQEMPWQVGRWKKGPGEVYGRSCGMQALNDVKMMQRVAKAQIRGAEKAINPSLLVENDGVMSPVRVNDSGITYVRPGSMSGAGSPVRPLVTGARPDLGEEFLLSIDRIVDQAYYRSLMETLRDPRATATQVIKIAEEQNRTIGPVVVRLQAEQVIPGVERFFMVLLRAGAFLPPPPQLRGNRLKVSMVGQLANAQRLGELSGIAQTFDLLAPIRMTDPTVDDNFDVDAIARHSAHTLGMPASLIRPERVVAEMRDARAKAQEQAEQVKAATMLAGAAGAAAPMMRPANDGGARAA